MTHKLLASALLATLSLPCLAQTEFIGFSYNVAIGATSRGALGTGAGEVMTRIDGDEVAGWGTQTPGFRTISSIFYVIQDQNAQPVASTIDIKLYPEDPANPGFPDLPNGVTYATGIAGPTGNNTIAAIARITPPATPGTGDSVPIQGGGDVFVSFVLPAVTPTSNVSIQIILGYAPSAAFTIYDIPSTSQGGTPPPAAGPGNSHGVTRLAGATTSTYNVRRMHYFDVAHQGSSGRALGITNQTTFTASNNPPPTGFGPAPGTGDFMSGSFPDVVGSNLGRVDDVAFDYYRTGLGTGQIVFFLLDIAPSFGTELPISVFAPGTGVACLNLSTMLTLGFGLTAADEAFLVTALPATGRAALLGLPFAQQAAAIDSATGLIHASPCSKQVF